ncbi:PRC-barrel domain-containing protein [Clostridium sp. Cult2]|uniref:PRC-barrel domain-containing protein n=1 Tax=Clostridium sp. Cult2 TaxID=2079003 RepID=UPI001F2F8CC2|nr:PRC-barrel domain-containing protein [Clostridium sp. Cult2]MCF6465667.1 hypothetical protein [Clostridium sp. Cult2]
MIRYKQLITLEVLDKKTKKLIGRILDVSYSDNFKKINFLIVKNDKIIKNKLSIPYRGINLPKNNEVIYVEDIDVFQYKIDEDSKSKYKFINKEIRLEDGECVGYVKDIVINKEDGSIHGFIITEGLFEDLIKGRNYIPLLRNVHINKDYIHMPYKYLI